MTLEQQIADLQPATDLADILRKIVDGTSVETSREAGYISVRPAGRHISAYLNRAFIDIATPPDRSRAISQKHHGVTVIPKTTATHYLHIPAGLLDSEIVVELIKAALDWRETGPQWTGAWTAGAHVDLAGETCSKCNVRISNTGACFCN